MALERIYLNQFGRIVRPLIRLLIENGVTYAAVSEKLKHLFYEVALEREKERGGKITDSRLSLATGMYRRDLRKLKEDMLLTDESSSHKSLARSIVSAWMSSPLFTDAEGQAAALPLAADDPERASFEKLVSTFTTDIRARTIWDEWLDKGIISLDHKGFAIYTRAESSTNQEDAIVTSGWLMSTHAEAITHNLLNRSPRSSVVMVSVDELSKLDAEQFAAANYKELRRSVQKSIVATLKEQDVRGIEERSPHTAFVGIYVHVKPGNHAEDEFLPKRAGQIKSIKKS